MMLKGFGFTFNQHNKMTHSPTSERTLWLLGSGLLVGASIWLQAIFWNKAASSDPIRIAHLAVGFATTIIYAAALCSATLSFMSHRPGRGIVASLAALTAGLLAILCQSGTYSYSETQLAGKARQAEQASADAHAIAADARQDAASSRAALQSQLNMLDGEVSRLSAQSADFAARNVITNGVKLVEAQLADIRARRESVAAQLASVQVSPVAYVAAPPAPIDGGPFDALFTTLSDFSGRPAKQLRAWFLIALPVLHEFWLGVSTIMLTSALTEKTRRVQDEEDKADDEHEPQTVLAAKVPPGKYNGPE